MLGLFSYHCLAHRPQHSGKGNQHSSIPCWLQDTKEGPFHPCIKSQDSGTRPGRAESVRVQQMAAVGCQAPRAPHSPPPNHPVSPYHGCQSLIFHFAPLGIQDCRQRRGYMNQSQEPRQGLLAPNSGHKVNPGVYHYSLSLAWPGLAWTDSPVETSAPPLYGPHCLQAPELSHGHSQRCTHKQALQALPLPCIWDVLVPSSSPLPLSPPCSHCAC